MAAIPPSRRIEPSPAVRTILEADSPKFLLSKHFLRCQEALLASNAAGLDREVTLDGRGHDLEAIGLPPGRI